MSYLNFFDTEAAWRLVHSRGGDPTVAVFKHANPCGLATQMTSRSIYTANACDPYRLRWNCCSQREVPLSLAEALSEVFTEVIVAPSFDEAAITKLLKRKTLESSKKTPPGSPLFDIRSIDGDSLSRHQTEFNWIEINGK
ncbi:MAG: hypothetical protein Ct9H90mP5_09240 [Acidimicrobiaceae bacterium]|nr:MAG: hypothetical protein Ct9H90mP5_09240 [Acidimicrobiaceae bacterium]